MTIVTFFLRGLWAFPCAGDRAEPGAGGLVRREPPAVAAVPHQRQVGPRDALQCPVRCYSKPKLSSLQGRTLLGMPPYRISGFVADILKLKSRQSCPIVCVLHASHSSTVSSTLVIYLFIQSCRDHVFHRGISIRPVSSRKVVILTPPLPAAPLLAVIRM